MINYSIVMRGVNSNLFAINAAKGRIKEALEKNETPAQADVELVKTEVLNAFASAQYADVMSTKKFAKHIASHGCVYSHADVNAILELSSGCMREMLLEGKKIRLGELGDFSLSLTSKGAETAEKFTAQNITGITVVWEPGEEFKNLLNDAEFNLVPSRRASDAVIKAIKAGQTVVDLNAEEKTTATPDGETPDDGGTTPPSGGQTPSGSDNQGTQNPPTGGEQTGEGSDGAMGE